jgi:hypothetical protein
MVKTAVFEAMMDLNLNCISIIMSFSTYYIPGYHMNFC